VSLWRRYLFFVQPLIDAKAFEDTKKVVESFRRGVGPSLQHALVSKDDHHPETSFVAGALRWRCTGAATLRARCAHV
jgi:hypothetical protein